MEWSERQTATALVGEPRGRVDENSWEAFLAAISAALVTAQAANLPMVLSLANIDYMSSRGLRVLTLAKRDADTRGVAIMLAKPNHRMKEILAISRYDKIFTVTEQLEA
ncbi:MAG: STAS domain-containing protein [Sphingomonadaceae bacterium]